MIEVELPDGTILEFPEGTSQDVIRQSSLKYMAGNAGPTVAAQDAALDPERRAYMEARARGEMPPPVPVSQAEGARVGALNDAMLSQLPPPVQPQVGQGAAALLGAGQGATLGFSDEIVAGIDATTSPRTYDQSLGQVRGLMGAGQDQNPWTYGGSQVAGAVGTSLATVGGLRAATGVAPTTMRGLAAEGAGVGAAEGFVSGVGAGEGAEDRLRKGLLYGTLGGVIGGASPAIVAGTRKGLDAALGAPIGGLLRGARNGASAVTGGLIPAAGPNAGRASLAIQQTMRRAGMAPDEVAAALRQAADEGQPEFLMADALGSAGQRRLAGVAVSTPDARPAIVEALEGRQAGQGGRVGRVIADALGVTDTAAARTTALTGERKAAADLAYEAARQGAGPVNLNGTLDTIDALLRRDPILGETALSQGPLGARLAALRAQMSSGDEQLIDFDTVLNIKSDLFDQISRGRGGPEISRVYGALDEALESSSQGYRAANDGYRTASGMIDAVPAGGANAASRVRAADTSAQYLRLPQEQQAPFRTGFADPLLAKVENAPVGVDRVRPLTGDGTVEKLSVMASDPALLQRQLERESTMFRTGREALGGSATALNQADAAQANTGEALLGMIAAPRATMMQAAGRGLANIATNQGAATREEIARMLLSRDVQAALAPALRAQLKAGNQNRVVEALMRSIQRPMQ